MVRRALTTVIVRVLAPVLVCVAPLALGGCKERAPATFVEGDQGPRLQIEGSAASVPINPFEVDTKVPPVSVGGSIALRLRGGGERMLHPVGGAYLFVPKPVLDRSQGTFLAQAPELYTREPTHRAAVLQEVLKQGGPKAMAQQLSRTLDASETDRDWAAAYEALPPAERAVVDGNVQASLRMGGPSEGLPRAARGPIPDAVAPGLGPRIAELSASRARWPRASAVLLLRYAQVRADEAARVACSLLVESKELPAPADDPEGVKALQAASLAVLTSKPAESCLPAIERLVLLDRCDTSLRCKADGSMVSARENSLQDEPLCERALVGESQALLAQPPSQVFAWKDLHVARLALGALWARAAVPPSLLRAHARRRYAIAKSTAPLCDLGVPVGASCTCDEPTLRDQSCRNDASPITVGFCRFEVDDEKQRIHGVFRAP